MFQKKSLGQNFLKSESALQKIVEAGDIVSGIDTIVEIGPGEGVLTEKILAKNPLRLIIIEKDDRLIPKLEEKFKNFSNITILHKDILEIEDFDTLLPEHAKLETGGSKNKARSNKGLGKNLHPYKVIANIPYYITGLIIRLIFSQKTLPEKVILMMQKEVVDRVVSVGKDNLNSSGKTRENLMSASIKFYGTPKKIANVPRGAFVPAPNVDSAILEISNIKKPDPKLENVYFQIIKKAFSHKRKKLIKNLEGLFDKNAEEWLDLLIKSHEEVDGLNLKLADDMTLDIQRDKHINTRPEEIDSEMYIKIAKNILN